MKARILQGTIIVSLFALAGCLETADPVEKEYDDCRSQGCSDGTQCVDCSGDFMCLEDVGLCPDPLPCAEECGSDEECVNCSGDWMCLHREYGTCPDPLPCPDANDPRVTYIEDGLCDETPVQLICGDEEESFDDECGCGCIASEVPVEPGIDLDSLTNTGGCSDVVMYAINDDATLALFFNHGNVVEEAHELGGAQTYDIDLSAWDGALTLREGLRLNMWPSGACIDYVEVGNEAVVEHSYEAVAGTATMIITPAQDAGCLSYACPAQAELMLVDVTLRDANGGEVHIEQFTLSSSVGWYPG